MSLIISLLPLYLFANFHCLGMCGPLAMMLGRHPHRYLYFVGRLSSFSFIGAVAGGTGALMQVWLQQYQVPALMSLSFGSLFMVIGATGLVGIKIALPRWIGYRFAGVSQTLSLLALKEERTPIFLFGFFTAFLPCGQSLMVFSFSALLGGALEGGGNGLFFALLTSPSLFGAMQLQKSMIRFGRYYGQIMGILLFFVGTMTLCRGFAEIGWISHLRWREWVFF